MMNEYGHRTCPRCGNHYDPQDGVDPHSRNQAPIVLKHIGQEMDLQRRTYDCLLCKCRFIIEDEKGAAFPQVAGIYKNMAGKPLGNRKRLKTHFRKS